MRLLRLALCFLAVFGSAASAHQPSLDDLGRVPLNLIEVGIAAKAEALAPAPRERGPLAFASAIDYPLGLADGAWENEGEPSVWRSRIRSPGAKLLALRFATLTLPEGAELWLYDPDGRLLQGPYRSADVGGDGHLWTAYVRGEQVVLELRVPVAQASKVQLALSQVFHGFLDPRAAITAKSGDCNIDVVCPQGDDWRDEIRSVVRLTYQRGNFLYFCTGTLVNNLREDETPFVLSAYHCGFDSNNDQSVVAYFNYQTHSCGGNPDGSESQTLSGATFLDRDSRSDFALLQLARDPPVSFAPYFAGWNADDEVAGSGATLHHPGGDEKRISLYDRPLERVEAHIDGQAVSAWEVNWSEGTTEQGSSGAGLWDQDHYIVGVLSGGNASCDNINGEDYYGRLELAWVSGLRELLDPDGTGALQVSGKDLGTAPANTPPTANDDAYGVTIDGTTAASFSLDVLSNDTAAPDSGETLSIVDIGATSGLGTALEQNGVIIYTPSPSFDGTETFTYTISDGNGGEDTATVSVTVTLTPPDEGGGGGGSMPWYLLILALAARAVRRRGAAITARRASRV